MEINYDILFIEINNAMEKSNILKEDLRLQYDYNKSCKLWNIYMWRYLLYSWLNYSELNKTNSLIRCIIEYEAYNESNFGRVRSVEVDYRLEYLFYCLYDNSKDRLPNLITYPYTSKDIIIKEILATYNSHFTDQSHKLRNLFKSTIKRTSRQYLLYVIPMVSLRLPNYVMMWILEWLIPIIDTYKSKIFDVTDEPDKFHILSYSKKIRMIENVKIFYDIKLSKQMSV